MEISDQLYVPAAYLGGKNTPVPVNRKFEWAPEAVWTPGKRENCLARAGNTTTTPAPSSP